MKNDKQFLIRKIAFFYRSTVQPYGSLFQRLCHRLMLYSAANAVVISGPPCNSPFEAKYFPDSALSNNGTKGQGPYGPLGLSYLRLRHVFSR